MQSSIWKLVSLAGVVGVCFLVVLMAQNGLKQDDGQQLAEDGTPDPALVADLGAPDAGEVEWPAQPAGDIQWEPELPQEEPPVNDEPAVDPFMTDVAQAEPVEEFEEFPAELPQELLPSFPETQVTEVSRPVLPEVDSLASNDPFADTLPDSFDPVESGNEPFAAPPAELPVIDEPASDDTPDLRALALELMQKAYQAIDNAELQAARDRAVAAGEIPVSWGPLEESPPMLIARIDEMLNAATLENVADLTAEPEPFPGSILPVAGEEPFSVEEPATALVADLNNDPFADMPAVTPDPLPTIDLPLIEEPAQEFDPFADTLPQPESPVNLPALDEPVSEPFPALEPAALAEAPAEPEPARLEPVAATVEPEPLMNTATAQKPDVTIRKVAPVEATLGEPLIYSIEISNQGETNASEVIVEDRIPKGCKLVGTIPQAELIGTKILWRLGRLPARSDQKIMIKVVPLEEGDIGSVATVNFVAEVSTSTSVKSAAAPDIKLEVSNKGTAKVGENVLFRFRVVNAGGADAEDVSLQDIVPAGFEHPAGKDVTYEIGKLPAGKSIDIDLELTAVKPGQHVNRAIVKSGKDSKVETSAAVEVVDDKGLVIKTPPSRPQPVGQKTSHEISVTNESSQPISGAALNVILPSELQFVAASDAGAFAKASNSIRWSLPVVQPGETVTRSTTVIPKTYGVHSSRVQLIQPDQPMEQSASLVEASGIGAIRLTLEDAPATTLPGEDFNVAFSVLNRGTGPDSNVQFSLILPTGIEFVSARGPVKNLPPAPVASGRSIGFASIPEIGERASVDFQITLRARSAGRPKIRAEVRSDQLTDAVATEAAIVVLDTTP